MTKKKKVAIILPICIILLLGIAVGIYFGLFYNKDERNDYYFTFSDGIVIACIFDPIRYIPEIEIPSSYSIDEQGHTVKGDDYVVTGIGVGVFKNETTGIGKIILPNTIKTIEREAFSDFYGEIILSSGIESIGDRAFYKTHIQTFDFTNVKSIGDEAFASSNIREANFSSTLESLGTDVFADCNNLSEVNIDQNNLNYSSEQGVLYNKDKTELILYPENKQDISFQIPQTVTKICERAFKSNSYLQSITLSDEGLLSIENEAFYRCSALTSIKIPITCSSIGDFAFYDCSNLTKVDSENISQISIGQSAFENCYKLNDFKPSQIISLGNRAFYNCQSLMSIKLTYDLLKFGANSFTNAPIIYNTYENGQYLGDESNPYRYLVSIIDKDVSTFTIKDGCVSICNNTFEGCNDLYSVTFPTSLQVIGDSAFKNCSTLYIVKADDTRPAIQSIGSYAFYGCEKLTSVEVGQFLAKKIEPYTFYNCLSLEDFFISNVVQIIDSYAFYNCKNLLTTFHIADSLETIGSSAFERCELLERLFFPKTLKNIEASAFKGCNRLSSIQIPQNVTTIGSSAFEGCELLEYVLLLSDNLKSIEASTFKGCKALIQVSFGDSLETIGSSAFEGCGVLERLYIPGSLKNTFPESLKNIGDYAFKGCNVLSSIKIPQNVTTIGSNAFENCNNLTEITIESETIYSMVDNYNCGRLLANATTIKVYESFIQAGIANLYIIQNFPVNETNGEYRIFKKA